MDKQTLLSKVKGAFTKEQVIKWVECLESAYGASAKPRTDKAGDVYMHPIFGHPYVLLQKTPEHGWVCALMTSEEDCKEILMECSSRFFPDTYFTKVLFTVDEPTGRFMTVYDNNPQLKKVHKKLREIFE